MSFLYDEYVMCYHKNYERKCIRSKDLTYLINKTSHINDKLSFKSHSILPDFLIKLKYNFILFFTTNVINIK